MNAANENQIKPLIGPAQLHRTQTVKTLLQHGSDRSAVDRFGVTAAKHTGYIRFGDAPYGTGIEVASA